MDISSIRSLVTLVVQLHTVILFAHALSEERTPTKARTESNRKPCCLNGGLCVLGSFCHCPKGYYGRYCEYELKSRPCGHISHGSWVKAGCNLCRCFDGHMPCLPRAFDGCDDKPLEDNVDPWDYKDELVVIASGESTTTSEYDSADDGYYDYYDSGKGRSGASQRRPSGLVVFGVVLVCVWWWRWSWRTADLMQKILGEALS